MASKTNTPVQSAQARKAALTRHHGPTHPSTLAADAQVRNAQLMQQLTDAAAKHNT